MQWGDHVCMVAQWDNSEGAGPSPTQRIGAKLGRFVIVDVRPTDADISHKIFSSQPQSTR